MDHYFASPSLSPPWLQSRKRRHYLESDSDDEEEDQVDHKLHHQQQLQQAPACFGAPASPVEQSHHHHHQLHYPYQQQLPHPILTSNGGYHMNPIIDFSGFSYGALFSPVLFPPAPPPLPVISSSSTTTNNSTASANTMMPPSPPTTVSYVPSSLPSAATSLQTNVGDASESPSLSTMDTRSPSPLSSSSAAAAVAATAAAAAIDGSEPIFQAKPSTTAPSSPAAKPTTRRKTTKSKRSKTSSSNKERKHAGRRVSPESPDDTEQRIFKCTEPTCGKLFKRSEHVKRHYRSIHSKEKPYECPYSTCLKRFSRSDNLSQHIRIHRQQVPKDAMYKQVPRTTDDATSTTTSSQR
ncbi:hypothetical protein O0I10_002922 [Lichtheimia ornata]|uniref:C2H2-type domain-containing protein n=1 Tax=Lichtheimia ornata TaxID=688661 RepID=A0AAD7XXV7_9FUNG|nr:uncharacterized protein O0I10_002922 [Lichtheimia ornata]KAJ8661174.1 hypothetical protein O0I10_002922 [Lichtheimia ornata]